MKEDDEKDKMQVLKLMEDGTLVVQVPDWQKVGRVLVVGSNGHFCKLFYEDEIVRCKDCKHFRTPFCKLDINTDIMMICMAKEDDYCSYGERREE